MNREMCARVPHLVRATPERLLYTALIDAAVRNTRPLWYLRTHAPHRIGSDFVIDSCMRTANDGAH
jgi:hypothetical protein